MIDYIVDFLEAFQGLRKTIVMVALIGITAIFRAKGLIDPTNFEGLLKATVVAYFGSNSIEHFTAMVKTNLEGKAAAAAPKVLTSATEEG